MLCGAGAAPPIEYAPKFSNVGVSVRLGLLTVTVAVMVGLGDTPGELIVMTHVSLPAVALATLKDALSVNGVVPDDGVSVSQLQSVPSAVEKLKPEGLLLIVML